MFDLLQLDKIYKYNKMKSKVKEIPFYIQWVLYYSLYIFAVKQFSQTFE